MGLLGYLGRQGVYKWCEWERKQNMSADERWLYEEEKARERERQNKKYREGYKRAFGVYPEDTWRW